MPLRYVDLFLPLSMRTLRISSHQGDGVEMRVTA